jgi:hypothetical protein
MEIKQIRKNNFDFLLGRFKQSVWSAKPAEPERGMLKKFAAELKMSHAYISHINTGFKDIGDKTARRFEEELKLPAGWMDVQHEDGEGPRTAEEQVFIAAATEFFRKYPKEAQTALLQAFADKFSTTKND